MKNRKFTCQKCLQVFLKNRTEKEAKEEFMTAPWNIPGDEIGLLCDECFNEFKIWFSQLSAEDHKRIRKNIDS